MSSNLFKKVACFTDLHVGAKGNSKMHNEDCESFVDWFISEAKRRGAETCIFLGDWHHHRSQVNVSTLNYTMRCLRKLNSAFDTTYVITGNHDLFFRENRSVHSMVVGSEFSNIVLVDSPLIQGNVAIVPFLVDDEWKQIIQINLNTCSVILKSLDSK